VTSRRVIGTVYLGLFAAIGVGAAAMLWETRAEYVQLKSAEAANRQRLAEAQAQLARQKKILERLRSDPEYVEKILRGRGYARPGDLIFKFDD
jgi:cell division protein DivIC